MASIYCNNTKESQGGILKGPIRYFGGKTGMEDHIYKYYPDECKGYLDPFFGSGAMFFHCKKYPIEVINDINQNVYSLFKVLSDETLFNNFRVKANLAFYSEQIRQEAKDRLKTELSLEERAFYFYYYNRTSRNGNGGFAPDVSNVRMNLSKSITDYMASVERLPEIHSRIKQAIVLNQDAINLLSRYDLPNWFYYLDPPYHWSTRTNARYENDMNDLEQQRFLNTVLSLKNAKVLISGYDCKEYSILEENGFSKVQFIGSESKKVETLWMNYTITNKLFD